MGFANVQGRLDEALGHLMEVNGWDPRRAESHLQECERTWLERSRKEWFLDVGWLTATLGIESE